MRGRSFKVRFGTRCNSLTRPSPRSITSLRRPVGSLILPSAARLQQSREGPESTVEPIPAPGTQPEGRGRRRGEEARGRAPPPLCRACPRAPGADRCTSRSQSWRYDGAFQQHSGPRQARDVRPSDRLKPVSCPSRRSCRMTYDVRRTYRTPRTVHTYVTYVSTEVRYVPTENIVEPAHAAAAGTGERRLGQSMTVRTVRNRANQAPLTYCPVREYFRT